MSSKHIHTQALVLSYFSLGDTAKVYSVLSPELGRISIHVAGAKKPNSKKAYALNTGSFVDLQLRQSDSWYYVDVASLVYSPDLINNSHIYYIEILDLASSLYPEGKTSRLDDVIALIFIFAHIISMNIKTTNISLLSMATSIHILDITGFLPLLNICSQCQKPLRETPEIYWRSINSSIICKTCASDTDNIVSANTIRLLYFLQQNKLEDISKISNISDNIAPAQSILYDITRLTLGRELRSTIVRRDILD